MYKRYQKVIQNDSKGPGPFQSNTGQKESGNAYHDVSVLVRKLDGIEDCLDETCLEISKELYSLCRTVPDGEQKTVGEQLVKDNFTGIALKLIGPCVPDLMLSETRIGAMVYNILGTILNVSDVSAVFAKDVVKCDVIKYAGHIVSSQKLLDMINVDQQQDMPPEAKDLLFRALGILLNTSCVITTPEELEKFNDANIKEILRQRYLSSGHMVLRTLATMTLTNILTEEENKIFDDTGAIAFISSTLGKALMDTERRRHEGFKPTELVDCLSRMSVNENNKPKIVEEGALPHLVLMLEYNDVEEQAMAARTIWNLSFDSTLRDAIRAEPRLVEALEALRQSPDKNVRKYSKGALWTLNESQRSVSARGHSARKDHVFISYAWANQDVVKQINAALKGKGFRTWVDYEQMGGSTLEAMAEAVENAAVVVICASENYKQSPSCRAEAHYTFQRTKPILPLMMQRRYKPDGWLGMLLGTAFYVNFDGKYTFDVALSMLLKELSGRGRDSVNQATPITAQAIPGSLAAPPTHSANHNEDPIRKWSNQQVRQFFNRESLRSLVHHFDGYSGKMLSTLCKLRQDSPDIFYQICKEDLKMDMPQIILLMSEMDDIL